MVTSINRVTGTRSLPLRWGYAESAAGQALVAAIGERICHVDLLAGEPEERDFFARWPGDRQRDDNHVSDLFCAALSACSTDDPVELLVHGTDFQLSVWRALTAIPAGETRTYGEVATAIGRPRAARAVGSAVAANTLALLIPCHRLLPASGGTGAFRWGADLKRSLLDHEAMTGLPAGCPSAPQAA